MAGAWDVAPRAGAWIETYYFVIRFAFDKSPPVRGRGLKHLVIRQGYVFQRASPPVRGRGLKRLETDLNVIVSLSPPVRGRERFGVEGSMSRFD